MIRQGRRGWGRQRRSGGRAVAPWRLKRTRSFLILVGLFGAAHLYADGVITPILMLLVPFLLQHRGTAGGTTASTAETGLSHTGETPPLVLTRAVDRLGTLHERSVLVTIAHEQCLRAWRQRLLAALEHNFEGA
jgi:hypothetical protein